MQTKGKWIVIEGIDGAGKTTAMALICSILDSLSIDYLSLREPGGTLLGEAIRNILKQADYQTLPMAEVLLLYAARLQLLETKIKPSLNSGQWILLDRHELSTFAYQCGGRGIDMLDVKQISEICLGSDKPDLTIFLSVAPKRAVERMTARGQLDHIEQQSLQFFENVTLTYEMLLDKYPHVIQIDANQDINDVKHDITAQMNRWINQNANRQ